jgi:hypothetical protein
LRLARERPYDLRRQRLGLVRLGGAATAVRND